MSELSSGAKKDFLVLNFAHALLTIATERTDELTTDDVKFRDDNKNHKTNKRIDNRLIKIKATVSETIQDVYGSNGSSLAEWVRDKTKTKIIYTLQKIDAELVNLEYLLVYILYSNFSETERLGLKLDNSMKPIGRMSDYLMDTAAMFEQTKVASLESNMYSLAGEYIKKIKE